MNTLGDALTTHPIQAGGEISVELYPNQQFRFDPDPDCRFGNGVVSTRTRTQSDGPEPLLTPLVMMECTGWTVVEGFVLWVGNFLALGRVDG